MLLAVLNSITTPIEIAFRPPSFEYTEFVIVNLVIDTFFGIDIILNFITSYFNPSTGDEELDPKAIAKNYVTGSFWIDFLSVIPFDHMLVDIVEDKIMLKSISILKIFRILRL